jgi:lysozyme family protein
MAAWTYDEALERLLAHEGGYTNHPSDPGGPTNFGITIHDYRKYIDPAGTAADVRRMSVADAKAIYKSKYWNAMRCDELPAGVDYAVFDYGVNSGIGRAPKVLKRALGLDASDSNVTPQVIAAARSRNAKAVVDAICNERLRFLQALRTWPVFGTGWGRRVREVRAAATAMTQRAEPAQPVSEARPAPGRGEIPDNKAVKEAIRTGVPTATAAAGYGFWDWVVAHPATSALMLLLIAAGIAIGVDRLRQRRRRQQEMPMPGVPTVPASTQA